MYRTYYGYPNYLYHHGVKGMKWGVRKEPVRATNARRKKQAKVEKYRDKLVKRAGRRANKNNRMATSIQEDLDSLKKYGKNSNTYQDHIIREAQDTKSIAEAIATSIGSSESKAELAGLLAGGASYVRRSSDNSFDSYVSELRTEKSAYLQTAKKYTNNQKVLMNTKITGSTTKKDLRKTYRKGLAIGE